MSKKDNADRKKNGQGEYNPVPKTPLPTPTNPGHIGDARDKDKIEDVLNFGRSTKSPFDTTLPGDKLRDKDASDMKGFNI